MQCEGIISGSCPGRRSGGSVKLVHDLQLCPECSESRFPSKTEPKQLVASRRGSNANRGTEKTSSQSRDSVTSTDDVPVLVDGTIAYIWFALQGGTAENVRLAVFGHFAPEQVSTAKNLLWEKCGIPIIGEKHKRKDSATRSAADLGLLPRSHPEELNNISLVDRLNRMQQRLSNLQESVDRTICENFDLKQRVDKIPIRQYSDVVSGSPSFLTEHQDQRQQQQLQPPPPPSSGNQVLQLQQQNPPPSIAVDLATAAQDNLPNRRPTRGRGRGYGRGRGTGRGNRPPASDLDYLSSWGGAHLQPHSLDRSSAASFRDTSRDRSEFSDDFRQPSYAVRRDIRKQKRKHKVITGNAPGGTRSFKGAPEPSRSLFVYRVDQNTETQDLKSHLRDMDIEVRLLECVSHRDSNFKSFKLDVPVSVVDEFLNGDVWPQGVRIRRFFSNRKDQPQTGPT